MKNTIYLALIIALCAALSAHAQVAGNPPYTLEQSLIASGGGTSAGSGNQFSLTGALGQSIAGTTSTNNPFSLTGGFFTAAPLAPTAAGVSIGGRVLTADGKGLANAVVVLTLSDGQTRSTRSSSFGNYRFEDIEAGQTIILNVNSKRFQFAPHVVSIKESLIDYNIVALFSI